MSDKPSIDSIFCSAIEIESPDERRALVEQACGEDVDLRHQVERLLHAHFHGRSILDAPAANLPSPPPRGRGAGGEGVGPTLDPPTEAAGTVIGSYKLLEQIGEGGMGTVWLAEQTEPIQRRVAVKVIKAGMDSKQVLARFEAERQALALMDHPNIAKVLDAGSTGISNQGSVIREREDAASGLITDHRSLITAEGRPYFVMELVKGTPITTYCDDKHLDVRQRLELFGDVCRAVQHAHQKGIIHRDLKPSNILIAPFDGKPVVKVIDFGVAKATGQRLTDATLFTGFGAVVGTPEYMSPEQAETNNQDIDTRSDIYSLGVLLYELLTGSTPLTKKRVKEAALLEVLRVIREEEPPKPSTRLSELSSRVRQNAGGQDPARILANAATAETTSLASISAVRNTEPAKLTKLVRGELDWIVMKALEKDRNRRYETANAFAADVQRYLNDETVEACPPSSWYRFRKFTRRNKVALLMASVVGLAVLLGVMCLAVSTVLIWVEKERTRAEKGQKEAALEQAERKGRLARQAADNFYTRFAQEWLANQPRLTGEQREFLQKALDFYERLAEEQGGDAEVRFETALAAQRVGYIRHRLGQQAEAEQAHHRAIALFEELAAENPTEPKYRKELAGTHNNLGLLLQFTGRPREAEQAYRRALPLLEQVAAEGPADGNGLNKLGSVLNNLANLLHDRGETAQARRLLERAIDQQRAALKVKASAQYRESLGNHFMNLGSILTDLRELDKAKDAHRQAREFWGKLVENFPHAPAYQEGLAKSHDNLARLLHQLGRFPEVEEEYRQALKIWDKLTADFPELPDYQEARADTLFQLASLMSLRAAMLTRAGKFQEAEEVFPKALDGLEKAHKADPAVPWKQEKLANCHSDFGRLLARAGRPEEAVPHHHRAIALQKELAAKFPDKATYQHGLAVKYINLGVAYNAIGRQNRQLERPLAEEAYRQAKSILENLNRESLTLPVYRQDLALADANLGAVLHVAGKLKQAERLYLESSALYRKLAEEHRDVPDYRHELARTLDNRGLLLRVLRRLREAVEAHREAVALYDALVEKFPKVFDYRAGLTQSCNNLAWLLATGPDPKFHNPVQAVALAKKAVELQPKNGGLWNTLGASCYRAGNWEAAIEALQESMKLSKGGDSSDWFFLAMAYWKLDKKDEARKWYGQAVKWMEENKQGLEKNKQAQEELGRFRSEAAELLKKE